MSVNGEPTSRQELDPTSQASLQPEWKNAPRIDQLKKDFDLAKPAHDAQMKDIDRWNDLLNTTGKARPEKVAGRSNVQPQLIKRQNEWRYPALSEPFVAGDKTFKVEPATHADAAGARQNATLLNWQFRTKINRVDFIDNYVRANVDEGSAIVRLGWHREVRRVMKAFPVYAYYPIETEEQQAQLMEALNLQVDAPRDYEAKVSPALKAAVEFFMETQVPNYAVETGTEQQEVEEVIANYPTLEVKNPQNIIIDPSCQGDLNKAMFVVETFEVNRSQLSKTGLYQNLDLINWESAGPINNPEHATNTPQNFYFSDKARKKVIAHEYWGYYDVHGNGELTPIVATWIGNVMIRLEENPYPDRKPPYVISKYRPIKRKLYGEPDAELLADNQATLGAVMRGMIDLLARSANAQQGIAKGMLDPVNLRKFQRGEDYEFNPNMNPEAGGLVLHKTPEISQSALVMAQIQNQEAESMSGVKAFSGGMSGEAFGDVAAGIRGVLDAASKREMTILRRLAEGMKEIAAKIIAMNKEFLDAKEVVQVTNEEFVEISKEDLVGQFHLKVDISTAEVDSAKASDLAFMLQTLGPNSPPDMVYLILAEIAELKRMPELAHKLRNFKPEPDPVAEKMKELEMQLKQAEVEEMLARAEKAKADARLSLARAEQADLDYVEQETGTKHARDMQRQQAQAEGNQARDITKALVTPTKEGEKAPDIEAAIGFNELSKADTLPPAQPANAIQRDAAAQVDPRYNLGSQFYDPALDPATNLNAQV
ncbi:portal protein [Delftia phage RG-2014]|uniref:Portal protein n=1 Tax=Delftia phage RG-2014 TaxID=1563661 RepID=A0A097PAN1_9CAUD|nr:portal protein [Delftia phage RG-2014]AIU44332.1 portal protein [Delftia phage RG-2014]